MNGTLKATFVYNYTYDANGNITQITDANGNILHKYYYDDLDQIIREDNSPADCSYTYTYDNAGNITSKKQYTYSTNGLGTLYASMNYSYEDASWKDLLTSVSNSAITYDNIGNPIQIGGKTLTWEGRQLKQIVYSHGDIISYEYNADGIRTSKEKYVLQTNTTQRHEYTVSGSQILAERVSVNGTDQYLLIYMYDENGAPIGLKYKDLTSTTKSTYLFGKNAQGDVCEIYNESGTLVGTYHYTAYGEYVISNLSWSTLDYNIVLNYNPFRYRGYYYDSDTQWYYLQSRYYNPEICRFINADNAIPGTGGDLFGYNMFSYCFNNPVNMSDPTGNWPKWLENTVKVMSVIVAVTAVATTVAAVSAFTAGTGSAAAVYGATVFLGAALSGINGGIANEAKGNSYINGYLGGATGGVIQGVCSKTPVGTIVGGGVGVTVGTAVTDVMNNLDPDSANSTAKEIASNAITSGGKALVTSSLTAYMGHASDLAAINGANGSIPTYTRGFGEAVKAFFGWIDDALVYIWE